MPIQGIFTELRIQTHLKKNWKGLASDLLDFWTMATVMPFADYFVADKNTYNLAKDAQLNERSDCRLIRHLPELCELLRKETGTRQPDVAARLRQAAGTDARCAPRGNRLTPHILLAACAPAGHLPGHYRIWRLTPAIKCVSLSRSRVGSLRRRDNYILTWARLASLASVGLLRLCSDIRTLNSS